MNRIPLFFLILMSILSYSQEELVTDSKGTKIRIVNNRVLKNHTEPSNGLLGDIWHDSIRDEYYVYDGSSWGKINKKETTYETIALTQGNQILNVRDADKIVGFTLISNSNWLAESSGRMSGTWMIAENRERIRCYIQTLEHPYVKFLVVSVKIENTTNQIVFTNYSSRYWTITNGVPQNNLSNNQNSYRLGKIVIIRKE